MILLLNLYIETYKFKDLKIVTMTFLPKSHQSKQRKVSYIDIILVVLLLPNITLEKSSSVNTPHIAVINPVYYL